MNGPLFFRRNEFTGKLITFCGLDGCGKSTMIKMLSDELAQEGYEVLVTQQPTDMMRKTDIFRTYMDNPDHSNYEYRSLSLMAAADRIQHVNHVILPALKAGKIVICDRFIDSSLAYQGMGRQIGMEEIFQMNQFATEGLMPDATIFLEVSEAVSRQRLAQRGSLDRMDQESEAFHQRVRRGYALVRQRYSERMRVIDADQELEQVLQAAMRAVMEIVDEHH